VFSSAKGKKRSGLSGTTQFP